MITPPPHTLHRLAPGAWLTRRGGLALLGLAGLWACGSGDSGPPNPAPTEYAVDSATTTSTGSPTATSSGAGGATTSPPPIRTMERRNPLGDTPDNHLVDGDFEYAATFEGTSPQAGWFNLGPLGQQGYVRIETGGLCRSGLRCGLMGSGEVMFGRGTSAGPHTPIEASVAARPPPGEDCSVVEAVAVPCDFSGVQVALEATTPSPADDGWCAYQAVVEARDEALCLYLEASSFLQQTEVVVDAARFTPAPAVEARRFQPTPAGRATRLEGIQRWIRDHLPIGAGGGHDRRLDEDGRPRVGIR